MEQGLSMQSIINELIRKHNLNVPDIDKALRRANDLFIDYLTEAGRLFTDKLSSAAAGIFITYIPILWRADDYWESSNSFALKEHPQDNILLSYLSPEQQEIAKFYVMVDYFKFIREAQEESGLVDKNSQYAVRTAQTRDGQTRYQMHYY